MFMIENFKSIEQILNLSNYWLSVEKTSKFFNKYYNSTDYMNNICKIEEILDKKSLKYTYYIEIIKNDNKQINKVCRTLEDVHKFLQWN